eukprot:COSAG04_NODE_16111_length_509_cov_1.241463_1_plen_74_part_10
MDASQRRQGTELAISGEADQTAAPAPTAIQKTKEASLKELAVDEGLSEEARNSAMKALEVLVASELTEIERVVA